MPSTHSTRPGDRRGLWLVVGLVGAASLTLGGCAHDTAHQTQHSAGPAGSSASDGFDARAAAVMPFDQAVTRHVFAKTAEGGVQTVTANDPKDARNIGLIQSHLAEEADAFRKGNYSDPAKIHGMDMPGVAELSAGASRVQVRYQKLPTGASITYTSPETGLVDALHTWFDRQEADHGSHTHG